MDALVEYGCIVCRNEGRGWVAPEIHHLRGNQWSGMGKRASHKHTIPLCPVHHRHGSQHDTGYHQSPAGFQEQYGTQAELLAQIDAEINDD